MRRLRQLCIYLCVHVGNRLLSLRAPRRINLCQGVGC